MARFLAIDADAAGLFVASGALGRGGGISLDQAAGLADDAPPLSAGTAVAVGQKLKDLLRQAGIKPAPVLLCLGRDRVILKDVRHPPTAPADEPAVVKFQASRELTDAPDDVVMDYTPITSGVMTGERRALAVFVRKELLHAAKLMCDAAGLRLEAVTPRPFAVAAALRHAFATGAAPAPDDATGAVAVVSLWEGGGEFTVVRGADITFALSIPSQALTGEASLIGVLKRNLAVYSGQNPAAPVQAVYLADSDDAGAGWSGRVRAALSVPVYAFDPVAGQSAAELIPPALRGRFAGPVGMLAARAASATLPINFKVPRQPRAEPGKARARVLLGVLAGLVLFAALGALAYLQIDRANREVATLTAERDELDQDLARYEPEMKRLAAADEFRSRGVVILDLGYDLADMIPDVSKATVTEIDVTAIPPPKKDTRPGAAQVAPKDAPPQPIASLRVVLRSGSDVTAQRLVDGLEKDKYYARPTKQATGGAGSGGLGQQYIVTAQILPRGSDKYSRRLTVRPPAPPAVRGVPAPAEPVFNPADFDGGFGQ